MNKDQPQTDSSSIGPLKKRACLFDWPEKQHNEICTHIESNINTSAQCFSKLKDQKKIEGENLPQEDDEMDLNEWLCDDYWKKKTNGKKNKKMINKKIKNKKNLKQLKNIK